MNKIQIKQIIIKNSNTKSQKLKTKNSNIKKQYFKVNSKAINN